MIIDCRTQPFFDSVCYYTTARKFVKTLSDPKLSYKSCAVSNFNETEIEIWAGFEPVGNTEKKIHWQKHLKKIYFSVRTKNLHRVKVGKTLKLSIQNRLQKHNQLCLALLDRDNSPRDLCTYT